MTQAFSRGFMFTLGALFALTFIATSVQAASGGLFGEIIAKILGITPTEVATYAGDGTVRNASRLEWYPASTFQRIAPGQSCSAGRCIYAIDPAGNILCR